MHKLKFTSNIIISLFAVLDCWFVYDTCLSCATFFVCRYCWLQCYL